MADLRYVGCRCFILYPRYDRPVSLFMGDESGQSMEYGSIRFIDGHDWIPDSHVGDSGRGDAKYKRL